MIICGIDPGLHGAIALLSADPGGGVSVSEVLDIPTHTLPRGGKNKSEVDVYQLVLDLEARMPIGSAFVEQVWSTPQQGVSSAFAFGKTYGICLGVLAALGVPVTLVPPRRWKAALAVPAAKDGARARASQLLPASAGLWRLGKHDGRAEASLIALWGVRSLWATGD